MLKKKPATKKNVRKITLTFDGDYDISIDVTKNVTPEEAAIIILSLTNGSYTSKIVDQIIQYGYFDAAARIRNAMQQYVLFTNKFQPKPQEQSQQPAQEKHDCCDDDPVCQPLGSGDVIGK